MRTNASKECMLLECGCIAVALILRELFIIDKEFLWAVFQWKC
ncbi:hypothetical protein [Helicobacter pylori]|nr:hypothetical protein [Helicobacter pylori]